MTDYVSDPFVRDLIGPFGWLFRHNTGNGAAIHMSGRGVLVNVFLRVMGFQTGQIVRQVPR